MTYTAEIQLRPFRHLLSYVERTTVSEANYRNSALGLKARQIGMLGELIALEYLDQLHYRPELVDTTNHDIYCKETGHTIDVKTNAYRSEPHENYRCAVWTDQQNRQIPDEYLFVQLVYRGDSINNWNLRNIHAAYILGTITYFQFHNNAENTGPEYWDQSIDAKRQCKFVRVSDLKAPRSLIP